MSRHSKCDCSGVCRLCWLPLLLLLLLPPYEIVAERVSPGGLRNAGPVRFLSFFDYKPESVTRSGANLLQFSLSQAHSWQAQLSTTGTKGMLDIGDGGGPAIWNRSARQLATGWEAALHHNLLPLKPHFVAGDIPVVMLGDEVNDAGAQGMLCDACSHNG